MGLFYCPLLPLLNSVFIFLTFYIKKVSDTGWGGGVEPLSAGRGSGPASARPLGVPSPGLGLLGVCDWLRTPICCCLPPVHPHEELQGLSKAVPRLQLHLLLPAGAPPGPAPGRRAPGLCGQQVRAAEAPAAGGQGAPSPGALLPALPWLSLPSIRSSWDCGLFANYSAPWQVVPQLVALRLPPPAQRALHYLGSHAFSFPCLILLRCLSGQQGPREGTPGRGPFLRWAPPGSLTGPHGSTRTGREAGSQGRSVGPEAGRPGQHLGMSPVKQAPM